MIILGSLSEEVERVFLYQKSQLSHKSMCFGRRSIGDLPFFIQSYDQIYRQ